MPGGAHLGVCLVTGVDVVELERAELREDAVQVRLERLVLPGDSTGNSVQLGPAPRAPRRAVREGSHVIRSKERNGDGWNLLLS